PHSEEPATREMDNLYTDLLNGPTCDNNVCGVGCQEREGMTMVRRKHIRVLVHRLLAEHHIRNAPVEVAKIARAMGVDVQETPADDELSGFLYRDAKRRLAIIGVNGDQHANRRNFTAAHELGHYLLHDFDDVHVDRDFKVWLRNETSSQGTD